MIQKLCAGMPGRKTKSKKGFTLAELLIVVAIVAILVAIAIPVFKGSLDEAQKQVAAANERAARGEAAVHYITKGLSGEQYYTYTTDGKGGITVKHADAKPSSGDYVTITADDIESAE